MTIWKTIPSLPAYEASSDGNIRRATPYNSTLIGRVMTPRSINGYLTVSISGRRKYVHRLVCEAFHGLDTAKQAAHINGGREDNRPANLIWADQKANEEHKTAHGTRKYGVSVSNSKLTEEDVRAIRDSIAGGEQKTIVARRYSVHPSLIKKIFDRTAWRHVE